MDFTLSKQQQMVQKMYREFAENEVKLWQRRLTQRNTSPRRPLKRWASWA